MVVDRRIIAVAVAGLCTFINLYAPQAILPSLAEAFAVPVARTGLTITAPLLALWGGKGVVGATYDVLATWREKALDVRGQPIDCGHALQEEAPEATLAALLPFLFETTR